MLAVSFLVYFSFYKSSFVIFTFCCWWVNVFIISMYFFLLKYIPLVHHHFLLHNCYLLYSRLSVSFSYASWSGAEEKWREYSWVPDPSFTRYTSSSSCQVPRFLFGLQQLRVNQNRRSSPTSPTLPLTYPVELGSQSSVVRAKIRTHIRAS